MDNHHRVDVVVRFTVDIETEQGEDETDEEWEQGLIDVAWMTIVDCTPESSSSLPMPPAIPSPDVSFTRCIEEAFLISYPWRG